MKNNKSDYEPPEQTQLFDDDKPQGRPKKWGEETRTVTFRLPVSMIKKLRVLAALQDCTPSDIVVKMLEPLNVPGCK